MQQVDIVQGEDKEIVVQLHDEAAGQYLDLTSVSDITVALKKADGTKLEKKLSVTGEVVVLAATSGKFKAVLNNTDTAALKKGIQPIFITIDVSTTKTILVKGLEEAVNVLEQPF